MILHQTAVSAEEKLALSRLIDACRLHEPVTLGLPEDASQYLMLFQPEDGKSSSSLSACLIVCQAQEDLWECYAFTHPSCRRKGYFSLLLEKLCSLAEKQEELLGTEIDLVFLSDNKSQDGLAAARSLEMSLWYSEYQMELDLSVWNQNQQLPAGSLRPLDLRRQPIHEDSGNTDGWIYYAVPCRTPAAASRSGSLPSCIGTCRLIPYDDSRFYLYHVEIQEEQRFQGWGTSLLYSLLSQLPPKSSVILQVSSSNEPALGLYKKAGFRVTETLSYYLY